MSECPKCHSEIADATYCGCGWKRRKEAKQAEVELLVECAHFSCLQRAKVKIKTTTGWANLCIPHYEEHFRMKAVVTCETLGLHTVGQKRAWVRDAVGKLAQKWAPPYNREPGEDLEERNT